MFEAEGTMFHADTCDPLKQAAELGQLRLGAWSRGAYPGRRLAAKPLRAVRTVGVWDADRAQSWGLDWHRNEGVEFTWLSRGKLDFALDDHSYRLRAGDFTITRPWQRHRVGDPTVTPSRLVWLILDVDVRRPNQEWRWPRWLVCSRADLQRLTALLSHNEQPVWRADDEVARAFTRLGELAESPRQPAETALVLAINQLMVAVLETLADRDIPLDHDLSGSERTVELFLSELAAHAEHPWTLAAMAEQCGLARTRFAHHCRAITNLTPMEYLGRCRIESATGLLVDQPERSITDIALSTGFSSSQYFATVFRRHTKMSPRHWRGRHRPA